MKPLFSIASLPAPPFGVFPSSSARREGESLPFSSRRSRIKTERGQGGVPAFTLVEMLVTILLVGIALAGVFGGLRALGAAETKARDADLAQRLAASKLAEFGPILDPATADGKGDFTEEGYPNVTWETSVESGTTENVERVTVTATKGNTEQSVIGLVYVKPETTTTTGATP